MYKIHMYEDTGEHIESRGYLSRKFLTLEQAELYVKKADKNDAFTYKIEKDDANEP